MHGKQIYSPERFAQVAIANDLGVWYCDLPFDELIWDERVKRHFGLPADARVTIELFYERLHPDDRERTRAAIQKSIDEHGTYDIEYRTVSPGGVVRWIRAIGSTGYNDKGEPIHFDGITQDITNEKRLRSMLQERESYFRTLVDSSPAMLWVTEPSGACVYLSKQWGEYTGRTLEEDLGLGWVNAVHPDDRPAAGRAFVTSNDQRTSFNILYRLRRHDGVYRWAIDRAEPRFDPDGTYLGYVGMVLDVHDSTVAELALQSSAEELRRSNSELARFAFVASHDLKEPLRVVANYSQMLGTLYADKLDETAQQYIGVLRNSVSRMYELIDDLLRYSRLSDTRPELQTVDAQQTFLAAVENLETTIAESKAEVVAGTLPTLSADPSQLLQVFQNLIGNAIKYRATDRTPRVLVEAERRDADWLFRVRDNGIGIDPQFHDRVFVLFQRLHGKDEYSGTGIGLAICRRVIEGHSGKIWVESQLGVGATFLFTIPHTTKEA